MFDGRLPLARRGRGALATHAEQINTRCPSRDMDEAVHRLDPLRTDHLPLA